ncbi:hypothetical protein M7I_4197 [Glarea lozoyensis 74030]|uniref:Uncharacterized protein n=1 Tax=Glarea lozoyensis (strain ATCC 74030 / MF5533) TaxID=1104152 RepID=H0ENJ2_GLAL7|nr:hypothetical protein M7I_4197 [Glarea lozoyensis 74030]
MDTEITVGSSLESTFKTEYSWSWSTVAITRGSNG